MQFEIRNRVIKAKERTLIVGDNADYVAQFNFDEEWDGVTKTARFIACNGSYKDVLLEDDKCLIPCEVLKCGYAKAGVYSAEMTTTECEFAVTKSIKDVIGCECEPTPDVYEQLTGRLDDIQAQMPNEVESYFTEHKDEFKGDKGDKGDAGAIEFIIVAELPTENINESAMYLKASSDPESQNSYDEYIYTNGAWECIGTANVKVDLSDYVKNTDYATPEKAGIGLSSSTFGVYRNTSTNYWNIKMASNSEIDVKTDNYKPIVPKSLDYAVKVGLTTNTETLTDEEKANAQKWLGTPQIELTLKDNGAYTLTINKG